MLKRMTELSAMACVFLKQTPKPYDWGDKEFSKQMDDAVAADDASSLHRVPHDLAAAAAGGGGGGGGVEVLADRGSGFILRFPRALVLARADDLDFYGDEEEVVDSDASVELDVDEDVSDDEVSIDDDVASIDEGEVVGAS